MAKLSFLLLIVLCVDATAQGIIEGVIVNKSTGKPIPYVNVFLKKKSSPGTISNAEGKFRLKLADNDSVVFSHLSFKRKAISTQQIAKLSKIQLEESEKMLSEVVIMSDSGLLQMLRKAFAQIESNYSSKGMLFEGFFRETNKAVEDDKFIYFGESTIQFYKPPYSNRRFGRVKLISGAKAEITNRHKYSNVYFYSGVYTPQTFDFVKQRAKFINPSHFKDFNYSLAKITKDGDREIMEIEFKPKPGACCVGRFQLDRKTLAYTGAQYDLTKSGLNEDHLIDLSPRDYTEARRDIRYREIDGKWNLSVVIIESTLYNPSYKNHLHTTREFVATSLIESDHDPIKESDAITYTDIYSQQESKFSNDYWKENSTVTRDSAFQNQVDLLFKKEDLVVESQAAPEKIVDRRASVQKTARFMSRFSYELGFAFSPIEVQPGMWTLGYGGEVFSKNVTPARFTWSFDQSYNFKLNRSFGAFVQIAAGYSKEKNAGLVGFGASYRKRLAGWKHPLWLYGKISVGETYVEQFMTSKMTIYKSTISVMPALEFNYKFSSKFGAFAGVTVASILKSKDRLSIVEKKNIFTTKHRRIDLSDPAVDFRINGEAESQSGVDFTKNPTFLRVGLFLGVN